jgi:hypothetical protein
VQRGANAKAQRFIQRDGAGMVGMDVQERRFAARENFFGHDPHQAPGIAFAAMAKPQGKITARGSSRPIAPSAGTRAANAAMASTASWAAAANRP